MWGLLLLLMGTTCRGAGDHGNATTLTKDTFDAFLQQQREQQRAALVMFHVSWCKACQRTFPTFAAAATSAAVPSEVPVAFAHVDCTDDKACLPLADSMLCGVWLIFLLAVETTQAQDFQEGDPSSASPGFLGSFEGHKAGIYALAVSDFLVASGSKDGSIRAWNLTRPALRAAEAAPRRPLRREAWRERGLEDW
eukprot:g13212.t1